MLKTHFLLENLPISEPSLGLLGKFQHGSDHHFIKYNCAILFLWYMSSLLFYASKICFSIDIGWKPQCSLKINNLGPNFPSFDAQSKCTQWGNWWGGGGDRLTSVLLMRGPNLPKTKIPYVQRCRGIGRLPNFWCWVKICLKSKFPVSGRVGWLDVANIWDIWWDFRVN